MALRLKRRASALPQMWGLRSGAVTRAPAVSNRFPSVRGLGVRIQLEPSVERFDDLCHGPQEQRPFEQCGDLLARDREGNWTYQFAVTVDDRQQGITHVIRGDDLLGRWSSCTIRW